MAKNGNSDETAVFQATTPRAGRCCLCERPGGRFHRELRPTGVASTWQKWPYCQTCWEASQVSNPDPLAYWTLLYAIFEYDPRRFRKTDVDTITRIVVSMAHGKTQIDPDRGRQPCGADENACGPRETQRQRNDGGALSGIPGATQGICEVDREGQTETLNPQRAGLEAAETATRP